MLRHRSPLSHSSWTVLVCLGAGAAFVISANACSNGDSNGFDPSTANSVSATVGTGAGGATSSTTDAESSSIAGPGSGGGTTCNPGTATDDADGDGFTEQDGDCNDCDAFVNPDAVEVIAEPDDMGNTPAPADEDCDGKIDVLPLPCDGSLVLDSLDPMDGAKAIGACTNVTKADWVLADGSPPPANNATLLANFHLGHGMLTDLGANNPPQEGGQLLALSSGTARRESDPGFVHRNFDKGYSGNPPFGFPKDSPSCPGVVTDLPHDAAGLELTFKAPSNAQGITFDFNFFTFEWPKFICTTYNDFFVANMTPFPPNQTDGNISFDAQQNPISVNNAFLDVCACPGGAPCVVPPSAPATPFDCVLGGGSLVGTDFDVDDNSPAGWTNGATGWLRSSAPVTPNSIFTIRFVTYDSSDGFVDSTTLIDNWQWTAKPGTVETIVPD